MSKAFTLKLKEDVLRKDTKGHWFLGRERISTSKARQCLACHEKYVEAKLADALKRAKKLADLLTTIRKVDHGR